MNEINKSCHTCTCYNDGVKASGNGISNCAILKGMLEYGMFYSSEREEELISNIKEFYCAYYDQV